MLPAGALKLGHFAAERWIAYDMDPPAWPSCSSAAKVYAAVLTQCSTHSFHEAAHGIAHVCGIKDTSRKVATTTRASKLLGEQLGLRIAQAPMNGWSSTELAPATAGEYAEENHGAVLCHHRSATPRGAVPVGPAGGGKRSPKGVGPGGRSRDQVEPILEAPWMLPRPPDPRIRRGPRGPIICVACSTSFVEAQLRKD